MQPVLLKCKHAKELSCLLKNLWDFWHVAPYDISFQIEALLIFVRYSIIVKCWALNPEDRPDFNQLEGKVGKLLKLIADYMEFSMELLPTEESDELSG